MGHILILVFIFFTTFNSLITYLCSNYCLKVLEKSKSYSKAINRIRLYDKYLLSLLTIIMSISYMVLAYYYFLNLLKVSDYLFTLAILLGFVLSVISTFFSRLCYCYACNVLLKTKFSEYMCFRENFLNLLKFFFPLFVISFALSTFNLLEIKAIYINLLSIGFVFIYLLIDVIISPLKSILALNAKKITNKELFSLLDKLFKENKIKRYHLYYWDSSLSNESNAFISGIFIHYFFISTSLIESIDKRELEAVVLHEIGHLRNHHLLKSFITKLLIITALLILTYFVSTKSLILGILIFILLYGLMIGINLKGLRKYEEDADIYVKEKGYQDELISALNKTSLYQNDNKFDELFSTHPSENKRKDKVKK